MTKAEYVGGVMKVLGWLTELHEAWVSDKPVTQYNMKPILCITVCGSDDVISKRATAHVVMADGEKIEMRVTGCKDVETAVSEPEV